MIANRPYVPNDLLSRLVGGRMYSVEFVGETLAIA